MKTLIKNLESKVQILTEKNKLDEDLFNKKIHTLKIERDQFQKGFLEFDYVKRSLEIERDKYKAQFEDKDQGYKNQKFEKLQLKNFYDYSLKSGEQKNEEIKRLDIHISQKDE